MSRMHAKIPAGGHSADLHTTHVIHHNMEAYADPPDYDFVVGDAGIPIYTALPQETGGPVLEIGCGIGRVSIPIAQQGFSVTGLDIAPGMLEQARRKSDGLPVRWVEGDGRAFDLGDRFRLIFLTVNAFQQFLTNADQDALLARVHAHLEDEGLFAFETRNPTLGNSAETRRAGGHVGAGPPAWRLLDLPRDSRGRTRFAHVHGRQRA